MAEGQPVIQLEEFADMRRVFAIEGAAMRVHKGRSVVVLTIEGVTHYLKRFWLTPSQLFKGHVARGLHEMRMIDWLNTHGFAGPKIVRRGRAGPILLSTRAFFLMEEVADERPLEAAWRGRTDDGSGLIRSFAAFAARLHEARFVHTDFSERHILVGRRLTHGGAAAFTFRLIDVERAGIGRTNPLNAAADIATLQASICDDQLTHAIRHEFLDRYLAHRSSLPAAVDFRKLVAKAKPTKSFY